MLQYPSVSLQPGATGDSVKQLQDFLVLEGYMTQAQVNTGYGIYGPQTTAAVAALQKALNVDTAGYPGYWGPKTLAAVENVPYNATPAPAPTTQPKTSSIAPAPTQTQQQQPQPATPTQTQNQIQTQTAQPTTNLQKSLLSAVADAAQNATIAGKPPLSFADALKVAQNDPNIVAKYSDMAKITSGDFLNNLNQISQNAQLLGQQQQAQFTNEQRAFKEQEAAAGRAYSGFRQQAQQQLNTQEQGIIQSTRSQLEQQLRQAASPIEQQYGTNYLSTLPKPQTNYTNPLTGQSENINYKPYGGITGTVDAQKQADVRSSALNSYNTALFPSI